MVLGVRNSSAKTCPKTNKTARKVLPRTTASAADPPRNSPESCFGPQVPRTFFIFYWFLHTSKIFKNRIPQKTAKNLKSRTLDRPNGDFGMTFGVHLGIDFHEILDFVIICENHRNAYIQSISVGSAPSKSHIFRPKFNQKFMLFLMPHSAPHFLTFWRVLMPKCSILGAPWRPAGPKMAPKIAQVAPIIWILWKALAPFLATSNQLAPKVAFGALLGTILVDSGWILHEFWWIWVSFFNAFRNYLQ